MFITTKQFDWAPAYAADHNNQPRLKVDPNVKMTRLQMARALPGETVLATELYRLDIIRRNRLKALLAEGRLVPIGRASQRVPILRVADVIAYYESMEPPHGYVACVQWAEKNHITPGALSNAVAERKFPYIVFDGVRYAKPEDMQTWSASRAKMPAGYMRCSEWFSVNGIPPSTGRKLASLAPIRYVYISGARCAKVRDMELHFKPKPSQDRAS